MLNIFYIHALTVIYLKFPQFKSLIVSTKLSFVFVLTVHFKSLSINKKITIFLNLVIIYFLILLLI